MRYNTDYIRKLQKVRIALSLPSRTKSEQVRPRQGRPGEARAVGFWCKPKCKNMLPMLQFIYLFFFIFLLFFCCFCCLVGCVWLSTKMYKQHEEEPIGRSGYVCTLFISHTYWPAGATVLCSPLAAPLAPCSLFPATTSARTASTARARARPGRQPAIGLSCLVVRFPAKIGDAM